MGNIRSLPAAIRRCLLAPSCAAIALMRSIAASVQVAYADPAGSGVIVSAVRWLEGTLLGTIATVVAVIAVAMVGLMMLQECRMFLILRDRAFQRSG